MKTEREKQEKIHREAMAEVMEKHSKELQNFGQVADKHSPT